MSRRSMTSVFILSLVASVFVPAYAGSGAGRLRGELPRVLEEAADDERVPVSIVLADQLTGPALRAQAAGMAGPDARRRAMIQALRRHARRTQGRVRAQLDAAAASGRAARIRPLWIGNIVAADLVPEQVRAVAALPEVSHVNWSPRRPVFLGPATRDETEIVCGIELVRAPEVWDELGYTGEGALVALIDTGVCWYHPDIENQVWVNPNEDLDGDGVVMDEDDVNGIDEDGNGYVDDLIGYDIENGDHEPMDDHGHGSHCAGIIAGDGTYGMKSGMAPDAGVMVLRVGSETSDEPDVWEAMQYAAENGADAISMSLGWKHEWNPDRATWRTNCNNAIDMGTAVVVAAGNEGVYDTQPYNVRTPGDVPRVISVGYVHCYDEIDQYSARGPVTWPGPEPTPAVRRTTPGSRATCPTRTPTATGSRTSRTGARSTPTPARRTPTATSAATPAIPAPTIRRTTRTGTDSAPARAGRPSTGSTRPSTC